MTNHKNYKAFLICLQLLSGGVFSSQLNAANVTWDMTFFDNHGALLGNGLLTYQRSTKQVLVEDYLIYSPHNELTQFHASILSRKFVNDRLSKFVTPIDFNFDDVTAYEVDKNNTRGGVISGNSWSSIPILLHFFSDDPEYKSVYLREIEQYNNVLWGGRFGLYAMTASSIENSSNKFSASGYWFAEYSETSTELTPVPLPAGLPLFVAAVSLLGLFSCRQNS